MSFESFFMRAMMSPPGMGPIPQRVARVERTDAQGRNRVFSVIIQDGQGEVLEVTPRAGETEDYIGRYPVWYDREADPSEEDGYESIIGGMMDEDPDVPENSDEEDARRTDSEEEDSEED